MDNEAKIIPEDKEVIKKIQEIKSSFIKSE